MLLGFGVTVSVKCQPGEPPPQRNRLVIRVFTTRIHFLVSNHRVIFCLTRKCTYSTHEMRLYYIKLNIKDNAFPIKINLGLRARPVYPVLFLEQQQTKKYIINALSYLYINIFVPVLTYRYGRILLASKYVMMLKVKTLIS